MIIFVTLLGLSVGSFANVLVDRLSLGQSILGRSRCDHCGKILTWYDLVPIFSFIILKARCRQCKKPLSLQYPLVEAVTAVLFIVVYMYHLQHMIILDSILLAYQLTIATSLLIIFVADVKYRIIPDEINIIIGVTSIAYLLLRSPGELGTHVIAAFLFSALFFLLAVITRGKGMGMGDVKYVIAAGLALGFSYGVIALYLSFLTGAIVALILILVGTKSMKSTIAFGPFLTVSTLAVFLFGEQLWGVFARILGI